MAREGAQARRQAVDTYDARVVAERIERMWVAAGAGGAAGDPSTNGGAAYDGDTRNAGTGANDGGAPREDGIPAQAEPVRPGSPAR